MGANMLETENTLDALVEDEMEQYIIETAKQSIPRIESQFNRSYFFLRTGVAEFTLFFLLFLVIAWLPADFGLAFFTGQLAQNASREAAADPNLVDGTCNRESTLGPEAGL
jgi:TadE-like protein